MDGAASASTPVVPATGTTRFSIGASNTSASGANFAQGVLSAVLVTAPLTAGQATQLYTYLNTRKG